MFAQSGKTGDNEGETKTINKNPEQIWTKSPEMIVETIFTMRETDNGPYRRNLQRM